MTELTLQDMVENPQSLSGRLGQFLRDRLSAKQLSELIDCDIRTAENLRRGTWPIERHYQRLKDTFGKPFVAALHWPDEEAARIEDECRELEQRLREKLALKRSLQTGSGLPAPMAPSRSPGPSHR